MHIQRLDPEKLFEAYGIQVQMLYPWKDVVEPPFGAAWAVVPPGGSTKHHAHQEGETFFFTKGRGVMRIGDESVEVGPGSVCYHDPFDHHTLTNSSETEELVFLTVWWEDLRLWADKGAKGRGSGQASVADDGERRAADPERRSARRAPLRALPGRRHPRPLSAQPRGGRGLHLRHRRQPELHPDQRRPPGLERPGGGRPDGRGHPGDARGGGDRPRGVRASERLAPPRADDPGVLPAAPRRRPPGGARDPLPLVRDLRALSLRGLHPRPLPALRLDVGRQPVRGLRAAERLRRPARLRLHGLRQPAGAAPLHPPLLPHQPLGEGAAGVPPRGEDEPQPALALRAGAGRRGCRTWR